MRTSYPLIGTLMLSLLLGACGGGGSDGGGLAALAAIGAAGASTGNGTSTDTGPGTDTGTSTGTGTGTDGNGTSTGAPSVKTLVSTSTEQSGANCANGGVRIEAGPDGDGNSVLAASEVRSTQYACRDAGGASGSLVQMRDEPSGANCAAGGKAIEVGVDGDASGRLEASEISSTRYVCNGTDGSNVMSEANTLASIVSEAAGTNCVHGGSRVDQGVDSNANGVLDAAEVSATNFICNSPPVGTFPWVDVTGAAVQAQPNTGYIARNDVAQVVVTLPANPAIGDVIRVRGAGAGGWKIAQNAGQTVDAKELGGMAGASWTARESARKWTAVASSADGSKLVAVAQFDQIYTSKDSGVTWTAHATALNWISVASSADGAKLAAVAYGGQIYTSIDSGVTWIARDSDRYWYWVASSADGSKLVAVVNSGQIYTSTDSGVSWTPRDSARNWYAVSSSADGSKLVAVVNNGQIYASIDSGVTWTPRESNRPWWMAASSDDGSKLVAIEHPGLIYTSSDSGVTWIPRESPRSWVGIASSADGTRLTAVADGPGQIYTSADSGVNWTARESSRSWYGVASSADGSKLAAIEFDGAIYTSIASTTAGPDGSISGTSSDAIELQYVGDGMFTVLSHEGSLTIQ